MKDSAGKPAVLIIVENLPVPLDRRVWQESVALRDAGYQVVVICPQMRGYTQAEEILDGIQVYRHPISAEAGGFAGFFLEYTSALWGETRLAWRAWRRHRFRVMHLCNPPDLLFLVAWPFKFMGVRVVYDVHDLWPEMFEAKFGRRGPFYWLVRLAERLTYTAADVVLATNDSVRTVAAMRGGKRDERVWVVRTAPAFHPETISNDPSLRKGRRHLVGYVGVMGNADGVHYLLEAAAHLVHRLGREDIQFRLMGTGPEYEGLIRRREELGLGAFVDMPGRVSDDELFAALRTMDVGVSSDPINAYNDHCTMNKVLDYMAFGKPQVMFELKEGRASAGDAAVYVPSNSGEQLGEALAKLLDDPAKRERMGVLGAERMRTELGWERSVAQLKAAYRQAFLENR